MTNPSIETAMNEAEFKKQIKSRGEEYAEYEQMVQLYGMKIKNVQGMLKGSMMMAFRAGVISMLQLLDDKARTIRHERDLAKAAKQDFIGN